MKLATGKKKFPPGLRFHPTDIELLLHYLLVIVSGEPLESEFVVEADIYKFHPADLKAQAYFSEELNWYFFCSAWNKYKTGARKNRATPCGFWKPTGIDKVVSNGSKIVGKIKTLVFHEGKPAKGVRTDWVMHEYRLEPSLLKAAQLKMGNNGESDEIVVCKIFKKGGLGPRNGEQFGAAYDEKDWETIDHGQISSDEMNDTVEQVQSGVVSVSIVNQASASTSNGVAFDASPSRTNPIAAPDIAPCSIGPVGDPSDDMWCPDDFEDIFHNLNVLDGYFTEEDFFRQFKP